MSNFDTEFKKLLDYTINTQTEDRKRLLSDIDTSRTYANNVFTVVLITTGFVVSNLQILNTTTEKSIFYITLFAIFVFFIRIHLSQKFDVGINLYQLVSKYVIGYVRSPPDRKKNYKTNNISLDLINKNNDSYNKLKIQVEKQQNLRDWILCLCLLFVFFTIIFINFSFSIPWLMIKFLIIIY